MAMDRVPSAQGHCLTTRQPESSCGYDPRDPSNSMLRILSHSLSLYTNPDTLDLAAGLRFSKCCLTPVPAWLFGRCCCGSRKPSPEQSELRRLAGGYDP